MTNSTVDFKEAKKFDKNYKQWYDESGEFKILHQITDLRISYITDKIASHFNQLANLSILEVGCGGGIFTNEFAKLNLGNITALDVNLSSIEAARLRASQIKKESKNKDINYNSPCYIDATIEEVSSSNKYQYDVIIILEVIEHVADLELFLQHVVKCLKKGGMIILSTINRNLKSYLQAIIASEYILGFTKIGTHEYNKFVKPSKLSNIFNRYDLTIKNLTGLKMNLSDLNWHLSDDIDVNYFAYISK